MDVKKILADVKAKNPGQDLFLQAVTEVLETIQDYVKENPKYDDHKIVERMVEPDRIYQFKVEWMNDKGEIQINRGYRVQFNNAIGPYKGGLRFAPNVTLDTLKFLGFEQTFKNSLTTLPMGGGKGGSDFDPKGKSDNEIMHFCQAFMSELFKYIGPDRDVPAGDIGVGGREIGFLYGMYKKLASENTGVLTGKGAGWGGSILRPEATGFGAVYFVEDMLKKHGMDIKGKTVTVSGFGNVAWGAAKKATELGAKVICISGPDGYILDEAGMNDAKIDYMLELRASNNNVVKPFATKFKGAKFVAGKKPWEVKSDIAMSCAIQNELNGDDAKMLIKNGTTLVCEVSNMGCTADAVHELQKAKVIFAPGKAANAGGVGVSGLEMSQNAEHLHWTAAEVDERLHAMMKSIHENCVKYGTEKDGYINYVKGANVAGFIKVADSMIELGVC
ncbi:MAG: NADP-specific glutamate dehydrogenase [Bacteroidales bacterium]|jgi:glutamate dehydrogenase (NADP+)|nr:NADP-specific glutamate dehydrogenase [Bacteroidales bacterium]